MNIIPAIDLLDGRCVRLYQGDYNQAQTFNEDPIAVAQDWVETRSNPSTFSGFRWGKNRTTNQLSYY